MITPYMPGKFVWFELLTQDIDNAIRFYDGLFGWRSTRVPMGDDDPYPMINIGDTTIDGKALSLVPTAAGRAAITAAAPLAEWVCGNSAALNGGAAVTTVSITFLPVSCRG